MTMPTKLLFLLCSVCTPLSCAILLDRENPPAAYSFADYASDFNKTYTGSEHRSRAETTFLRHLALIRQHNADPEVSWFAGVNEFTDWTPEEFKAMRTGTTKHAAMSALRASSHATMEPTVDLPQSIDWRTKNVVTPPKNQGGCGSCWAFSATETLESAVAIATGKLFVLSPQEIVSCSPNPDHCGGSGGCQGSTQQLAFNYTMSAGIVTESDYPYQGMTGTCSKSKSAKPVAGIKGYVTVPPNNYTAFANAIATKGPISITVAAGSMGWQMYSRGVFGGGLLGKCGFELDHGVQAVGFGTDGNKQYWLVRNSWGASWGEKGYMRMRRYGEGKEPCGVDNAPADGIACKGNTTKVTYCGLCGILSSSSYVTGAYLK
jgi:cathepsin L